MSLQHARTVAVVAAPVEAAESHRPAPTLPFRFRTLELVLVVSLHLAVLAGLLALDVLPLPEQLSTLTVRILPPEAHPAEPTPPRPTRVAPPLPQRRPDAVPARQVLAAAAATPVAADLPVSRDAPASVPAPAPVPAIATASAPVAVSEARVDAAYSDNPAPVYPAMARRLGEHGRVVLRVFVEAAGRASQVELKDGSGSPRLDQAAIDAVRQWKFIPARRGAETVGAWVLVPIAFNLKG